MKRYGVFVLLLMLSFNVFAQTDESVPSPSSDEVTIGAISVNRTGSVFSIGYRLFLGESVRSCKVKLLISTDGGKSFAFNPSADHISGDIGQQDASGGKLITYDVTTDKTLLAGKPIVFKVDVVSKDVLKRSILASAQASVFPQVSYGFMVGMVKKYGWYVKARSDLSFPSSSYNCTSNGVIEGGGYIWTEGTSEKSRLAITAGGMVRASRWCYPYAGVGYGSRGLYWKDIQNEWAQVSDLSCAGLAIDAGIVMKLGFFAITVGVNSTAFKYTEAEIGIGVMF